MDEKTGQEKNNSTSKTGVSTIFALILSLVLILFWTTALFSKFQEPSSIGGVGLFLVLCLPIHLYASIFIVVISIFGFKTKMRIIAIASIVIWAIAILVIPLAFANLASY